MNFLAHAHLSGNNDEILFGNFIADGVKGRQMENYRPDIVDGIRLHRAIDQFTDSHSIVKNSIHLVKPSMGRYAGVAVDIFYDHFLASGWAAYSETDLVDFSMHVYKVLAKRYFQLPSRTKRIIPFMIAQNWLAGYAGILDLRRVFRGMDRRTQYKAGMSNAVLALTDNYMAIENDFRQFYPDLQQFAKAKLSEIQANTNG
ncbi:MAG: ACP phosphodiesterase [Bacteroidales bacterium]|nr:ACP phosphodiesterase [Bacteroidales bacterium]